MLESVKRKKYICIAKKLFDVLNTELSINNTNFCKNFLKYYELNFAKTAISRKYEGGHELPITIYNRYYFPKNLNNEKNIKKLAEYIVNATYDLEEIAGTKKVKSEIITIRKNVINEMLEIGCYPIYNKNISRYIFTNEPTLFFLKETKFGEEKDIIIDYFLADSIKEKMRVIPDISKYIEGIEKDVDNDEIINIFNRINKINNNFHLRHNNRSINTTQKYNKMLKAMSRKEIESLLNYVVIMFYYAMFIYRNENTYKLVNAFGKKQKSKKLKQQLYK